MNKEQFGTFIADARRQAGLTQKMLADQLHVTDKAVSKWERGLCYPDLTLIENLASTLGMTLTELMTCQKSAQEAPQLQNTEDESRSLLNIARESLLRWQKRILLSVTAPILILLLIAGILLVCLVLNAGEQRYAEIFHKQAETGNYFIYIEEDGHLLRLRCKDQQIYDAFAVQENRHYYIRYRWNRLTYQGTLEYYASDKDIFSEGDIMDSVGSSTGVGSLLGIDYACQQSKQIYPDPNRENGYLYTFKYYYNGNGTKYFFGEDIPETHMLTVEDCRGIVLEDYDEDGIVELFVLTKYDEEPYRLYDLEKNQIVSQFPEEVPHSIREQLQAWISE